MKMDMREISTTSSTSTSSRHHIHHAGHWFLVEAVKPDFTPALLRFDNLLLCLNLHILGNIYNSPASSSLESVAAFQFWNPFWKRKTTLFLVTISTHSYLKLNPVPEQILVWPASSIASALIYTEQV